MEVFDARQIASDSRLEARRDLAGKDNLIQNLMFEDIHRKRSIEHTNDRFKRCQGSPQVVERNDNQLGTYQGN
ncbi:hypothetical protein AGABI2DRAFT_193004 [Agaricus bisporus var. bisporus H97]|uniref:hypothetical protein n=1 Tax=Agaricus bisporus var. bisporus (strain H97 / ATCC MYA-4626 / FGSC 10389) TaxID=936046 RepID=UPI00029F72F6|nr:hypothetical protein AGABI2DRAFT_193004 [Agaricus bisporus var. bisporus H97]EKV46225.1 hypothetical protein AGABI2DRAFT_193004 [Agaricus bisporus var. bisporus H97]